MINSANTVDFGLDNNNDNVVEILPPRGETLSSNQLNASTYASKIPQSNAAARVFLNYGATPLIQYAYPPDTARAVKYISKTKDIVQSQVKNNNNNNNNNNNTNTNNNSNSNNNKERVRVQHLQTHEKLQNNRWNYHTLYNISAEMGDGEIPNNNNHKNNNNNNNYKLQNESAFFEDQNPADASAGTDCKNNNNISSSSSRTQAARVIPSAGGGIGSGDCKPNRRMVSPVHRTEDQENAFRRIEDVHNYAKLKRYSYSNGGSSNSSTREDDVDDEEEDDDDDDGDEDELEENEEVDDEDVVGHDIIDNCDDLNANYARYFSTLQSQRLATKAKRSGVGGFVEPTRAVYGSATIEETETDAHVDVETVPREPYELSVEIPTVVTPAHHARRPMNAFLIFCKRHRAIVKDRYKSLENRAITKILGDWWASLDVNDKKCFTNLAQLNKDAFFSANPNFKWCKLPAPPLRTLSTRPNHAATERPHDQEPPEEDDCSTTSPQVMGKTDKSGNYFKLADEAQMGELSTLLLNRGIGSATDNNNKTAITSQPSALQQALGETTQFLSTHMPTMTAADADKDIRRLGEQITSTGKRRPHSYSSNSNSNSEDDIVPPKKSARTCKGKIYQELINSGQIAAIAKKSPSSSTPAAKVAKSAQSNLVVAVTQQTDLLLDFMRRQESAVTAATVAHPSVECPSGSAASKRSASESLDDLVAFDLEERIKSLPALNLDAYLQRKRNTKKKKKFTAKKRNSNSASSSKSSNSASTTVSVAAAFATASATVKVTAGSPTITPPPKELCREPPAVGSQKRKARKESITRRDVNAIENEVAAALLSATDFTTINGCYYFNETPATHSGVPAIGHASPIARTNNNIPNTTTAAAASVAPAVAANSSFDRRISSVVLSNFSENISSTSDLLILAEVAANRTELTN